MPACAGDERYGTITIAQRKQELPGTRRRGGSVGNATGRAVDAWPSCTTCEMTIRWEPHFEAGKPFCCTGCGAGGPCVCSYDGAAE